MGGGQGPASGAELTLPQERWREVPPGPEMYAASPPPTLENCGKVSEQSGDTLVGTKTGSRLPRAKYQGREWELLRKASVSLAGAVGTECGQLPALPGPMGTGQGWPHTTWHCFVPISDWGLDLHSGLLVFQLQVQLPLLFILLTTNTPDCFFFFLKDSVFVVESRHFRNTSKGYNQVMKC